MNENINNMIENTYKAFQEQNYEKALELAKHIYSMEELKDNEDTYLSILYVIIMCLAFLDFDSNINEMIIYLKKYITIDENNDNINKIEQECETYLGDNLIQSSIQKTLDYFFSSFGAESGDAAKKDSIVKYSNMTLNYMDKSTALEIVNSFRYNAKFIKNLNTIDDPREFIFMFIPNPSRGELSINPLSLVELSNYELKSAFENIEGTFQKNMLRFFVSKYDVYKYYDITYILGEDKYNYEYYNDSFKLLNDAKLDIYNIDKSLVAFEKAFAEIILYYYDQYKEIDLSDFTNGLAFYIAKYLVSTNERDALLKKIEQKTNVTFEEVSTSNKFYKTSCYLGGYTNESN